MDNQGFRHGGGGTFLRWIKYWCDEAKYVNQVDMDLRTFKETSDESYIYHISCFVLFVFCCFFWKKLTKNNLTLLTPTCLINPRSNTGSIFWTNITGTSGGPRISRSANPKCGVTNPLFWPFPRKPHKIEKKIGPRWGCASPSAPS